MSQDAPRDILVELLLRGGHKQELLLREDSSELYELFASLAGGATQTGGFFQLPLDGGRRAFSFAAAELVAVTTTPPVVVQPDAVATGIEPASRIEAAKHYVIDDFLTPGEVQDLLAYALEHEDEFEVGTVAGERSAHRRNRVILDFSDEPHARLLQNRLLIWLPFVLEGMNLPWFPIDRVESQLTATNNHDYYRAHDDVGTGGPTPTQRRLSCVYYFCRDPQPFTGGALKLFDRECFDDGTQQPAGSYREVMPRGNRMVVFESDTLHELAPVHCPGGRFADSRFAVTSWLWRSEAENPSQRHGLGYFHCNRRPPALVGDTPPDRSGT